MKIRTDIFLMATALLLAACTTESSLDRKETTPDEAGDGRMAFTAYLSRGTTRAGAAGELVKSATADKVDLATAGFGVMAYHTEGSLYTPVSTPNFMYNQQVRSTDDGTTWKYTPLMYWPNNTESGGASQTDRVSVFGYAPWVNVDASTGKVTDSDASGIVALTNNTAQGDPRVRYIASLKPTERVDLCWADPKIDQTRPASVTDKLDMQFHHALASLNVLVDAYVDRDDATNAPASETRLWIRSITFEGFTTQGDLNLNQTYSPSVSAAWNEPYTSIPVSNASITVKDGRADGLEGKSASANERPLGLNPALIQSMTYADLAAVYEDGALPKRGVYNDMRNLFDVSADYTDADKPTTAELTSTQSTPLYVIPTDRPLRVTIEYDIETRAANLPGYLGDGVTHGISLPCRVSTTIQGSTGDLYLSSGKAYTVRLHLGVNSVQYAATVNAWGDVADHGDIEIPVEDLTISEIMLNVYVKDMEEQDPVLVSLPMTDLSDLKSYFDVEHDASDALEYLGKGVDKYGYIEGITGSKYNADDQVGIIGYISTNGSDVDASLAGSRILVLAISDAATSKRWKADATAGESAYNDKTALNGYAFTNANHAAEVSAGVPTYPAAYEAWNYDTKNASGTDVAGLTDGYALYGVSTGKTGKWFLPSARQWDVISGAIALQIWANMNFTYWGATEVPTADTNAVYFDATGNVTQEGPKTDSRRVRPIFAY